MGVGAGVSHECMCKEGGLGFNNVWECDALDLEASHGPQSPIEYTPN